MFYLASYNEEYISIAIHADYASKEKCQRAMKELVVNEIQAKFGYDVKTAELIYESAKNSTSANGEGSVLTQYGVNVCVYEDGASIDDGSYMNKYEIINYVSGQPNT